MLQQFSSFMVLLCCVLYQWEVSIWDAWAKYSASKFLPDIRQTNRIIKRKKMEINTEKADYIVLFLIHDLQQARRKKKSRGVNNVRGGARSAPRFFTPPTLKYA